MYSFNVLLCLFFVCLFTMNARILNKEVDFYKGLCWADNTKRAYHSHSKAYLKFCQLAVFLAHYNGTSVITASPQCANNTIHILSDASARLWGCYEILRVAGTMWLKYANHKIVPEEYTTSQKTLMRKMKTSTQMIASIICKEQ